ncbi:MAG: EVE domain-containing protein [Candidatus Omnitrophica bacterium]|nr:EVE domain-containing protein [Candidatus Omnitrophota bacterium]
MLEKDIENLIALYPEEFFPNTGFKLMGQQVNLGGCFADIVFNDKHNRMIIVEVKRGILTRDASGQIIEYYGLLKQQNPDRFIELILCANIIPSERKMFLENAGIECKELGLSLISNIAKKYNYKFLDGVKKEKTEEITREVNKIDEGTAAFKKENKIWIFQANPNRYDIFNALSELGSDKKSWMVSQHKNEIREGDIVLIWMSGRESGIYAVAEIISNPSFMIAPPEEEKYWVSEKDRGRSRLKVNIRIIR